MLLITKPFKYILSKYQQPPLSLNVSQRSTTNIAIFLIRAISDLIEHYLHTMRFLLPFGKVTVFAHSLKHPVSAHIALHSYSVFSNTALRYSSVSQLASQSVGLTLSKHCSSMREHQSDLLTEVSPSLDDRLARLT